MVVSLTLTPMLSSRFLRSESAPHGAFYERSERAFEALVDAYRRALDVVLRHQFITLLVFLATLALTILLFVLIPKGFLPTQDTGLITGLSEAAQDASPGKMRRLHLELTRVIERDPDVATVGSVFGSNSGSTSNTGGFSSGSSRTTSAMLRRSRSSIGCDRSSRRWKAWSFTCSRHKTSRSAVALRAACTSIR
jgi:multidrug efflux pump subunit AcrB